MTLEECRRFYAEEIQLIANLDSPELIGAFARVPREEFLGPGPWQVALPGIGSTSSRSPAAYRTIVDPRSVYHNVLIALDSGRALNNGQPSALASWINALGLHAGDRVFHLGCGVGYYTAIMAEMVGPGGSVVAGEVDCGLAARAKKNLAAYPNVTVHAGDGAALDPGICDAMFINAGVTHPHPRWLAQLAESGRIVVPLTEAKWRGVMVKITREQAAFAAEVIGGVQIYSCTSLRDARLEILIGKALETETLQKMKSVRRDTHGLQETCVLHGPDVCFSAESVPGSKGA